MIRRKHIFALTVTLMLLPLLTTCSMEERLRPVTGDGVPASVTLSFGVNGHTVYTRASQSEEDENRVDNLYILVFRKDNGELVTTANDEGERLNFFTASPQDGFSGLSYNAENQEGSVRFTANYNGDVIIVGVANITEGNVDTGYDLTKENLDEFEGTLDDFKEYVVSRNVPEEGRSPVNRGSHFLMTGSVETTIGTTADYDVLEDELVLERVDAKVTVSLSVDIANGDGISYENVHFEPKTWKVMRLPQQSLLLPYTGTGEGPWEDEKSWDAETGATKDSPAPASYTDTDEYEIEVSSSHLDDQTMLSDGGSFTFYMPENRKKYKTPAASYTDRETVDKADGSFVYADPNSTYIVVNGDLTFNATQEIEGETVKTVVDAFVTFTLHLGLGASADGNHNNYDTRRNSDYTYNIKVTGIESITTDVAVGRPGYEGDIIYNTSGGQTLFTLDAHYETRLISIPENTDFSKMTWSVITPFSSGVHVQGGDNSSLTDYEWIKFAVNAHYTDWNSNVTDGKTFAKFPGTTSEGILHYNNSEARTSEVIDDMGFLSRIHPLMNVDQLIKYLQWRSSAENGGTDALASDGYIYITAFIDEYYYPDKDWKEFVNTFDRRMHIIYDKSDNYAFYKAGYSFVQRSIRSIYNSTSSSAVTKAWGVETVTEPVAVGPNDDNYENAVPLLAPGEAAISNHAGNLSLDNGWKNTNTLWTAVSSIFNSAVDPSSSTLKDNYQNAVYACLLRNRDENGNGEINDNELKWYLASVDQLTDLYIGEWALNKDSYLYPDEMRDKEKPYFHYTTNSPNSGDDNEPWIFWAEEGASRGSYDTSQEVLKDDNPDDNNNKYSYRCLRNLFPEGMDNGVEPDPLVTVTTKNSGVAIPYYILNLSNLHPDALRSSPVVSGDLPLHDEQSEHNKAYKAFEVTPETSPTPSIDWGDFYGTQWSNWFYDINFKNAISVDNVTLSDTKYCPDGYRVPNQRELLIMSTFLEPDAWATFELYEKGPVITYIASEKAQYISRTQFSMKDKKVYTADRKHRYGFIYAPETGEFFLQNNTGEKGYVRCIKDIDTP